ncbi:uncharacterized protein [Spinacia oleracea]|uniref:Uncharacterized protein isoform X2 n=1 Tax=Spinacia oleracea TaxID=3562 RepID=A0ABM3QN19_SPIOL|nr:uncharacterized protein LOC130460940 isoform X2 [Spinacia oleracea]
MISEIPNSLIGSPNLEVQFTSDLLKIWLLQLPVSYKAVVHTFTITCTMVEPTLNEQLAYHSLQLVMIMMPQLMNMVFGVVFSCTGAASCCCRVWVVLLMCAGCSAGSPGACCSQVYRECGVRLLLCVILCCVPFYCICCVWLLGSGLYSSNFFCCFI